MVGFVNRGSLPMGDEPAMDRRRTDVKLDELIAKVDDVIAWQQQHISEDHVNLAANVGQNTMLLGRIVDLLEGEDIVSDLDGRVIDHRPGLMYEIETLRKQSMNGGIPAKLKLTNGQRALIVAVLGFLTAIVIMLTAIVEHLAA